MSDQHPYGQPPGEYPTQPLPGGQQPFTPAPPDHPQATTILILGILSLVLCALTAPFAWSMGNGALKEIDASNGTIGGRSQVQVGRIIGIVMTFVMIASVVFFVGFLVFVFGIIGATATTAP